MPIRLINHTKAPAGEFYIRIIVDDGDWRPSHSVCGGAANCKQFGPLPTVGYVAKELMEFLRGNKLPRADFPSCVELIDAYTCERFGNGSKWCYETDQSVRESSPTVMAAQGKCGGCGARV